MEGNKELRKEQLQTIQILSFCKLVTVCSMMDELTGIRRNASSRLLCFKSALLFPYISLLLRPVLIHVFISWVREQDTLRAIVSWGVEERTK